MALTHQEILDSWPWW